MKELYPYIFKRKSVRKYDMTPLSQEQLGEIENRIRNLRPLYPEIKIEYQIADAHQVKNLLPLKAPHYLVISSEEKDGYLIQAGFMFQQMDLYFSSIGLGSCWLGMAKPSKAIKTHLPFVIILAFGKPEESPYRKMGEFKRKELSQISKGSDVRLEAARLAPSATNSQKWFFLAQNDKIHIYQEKVSGIRAMMIGKMNQIDIGIALCHLVTASEHHNKAYQIHTEKNPPTLDKHIYHLTI